MTDTSAQTSAPSEAVATWGWIGRLEFALERVIAEGGAADSVEWATQTLRRFHAEHPPIFTLLGSDHLAACAEMASDRATRLALAKATLVEHTFEQQQAVG